MDSFLKISTNLSKKRKRLKKIFSFVVMIQVKKLLSNTDEDLPFRCNTNLEELINTLRTIIENENYFDIEVKNYVSQYLKFDKFINQFESETKLAIMNKSYEIIHEMLEKHTYLCTPTGE